MREEQCKLNQRCPLQCCALREALPNPALLRGADAEEMVRYCEELMAEEGLSWPVSYRRS